MSVTSDENLASLLPIRRLRTSEYHVMIDEGILDEDEHVELLEGVLVQSPAFGGRDAFALSTLGCGLTLGLRSLGRCVRIQLPLSLEDGSEPEPDVAIAEQAEERAALPGHPRTAALVIEASRDSLKRDRRVKLRLYARAGIPEYWILDVERGAVEVYTDVDPGEGLYRTQRHLGASDTLTFRGVSIPVASLLG